MQFDHLIEAIIIHGDLGHIALLLWASVASFACLSLFKEIKAANRRFDLFVRELHKFNLYVLGEDE
jgi:hypothetical protein